MTQFKSFNDLEQEAWDKWSEYELVLSSTQKSEFGLDTKAQIREWCYELGLQPDGYLFEYNKYNYSRTLVFRFENGTDLALLRMSLF